MSDIYYIASEIFTKNPQQPNSIQLYIDNGNINELFEILSILMGECLNLKLENLIKFNRSIDTFIITLKQYFQSFGFDFSYQIITTQPEFIFKNHFDFQIERLYNNFQVSTKFIYQDFLIKYIPSVHISNDLSDFVLYFKIKEIIYQLNFNYFH